MGKNTFYKSKKNFIYSKIFCRVQLTSVSCTNFAGDLGQIFQGFSGIWPDKLDNNLTLPRYAKQK